MFSTYSLTKVGRTRGCTAGFARRHLKSFVAITKTHCRRNHAHRRGQEAVLALFREKVGSFGRKAEGRHSCELADERSAAAVIELADVLLMIVIEVIELPQRDGAVST